MNRLLLRALALAAVSGLASTSALADLFTANFDELAEGFHSNDLTSGGIRFFDINQDLGGGDNFTIERANAGTLGGWFTPPNVLGFGGYVPGDGVAFGRMKSFAFRVADPLFELRSARLDIWTFLLQSPGNTVTLEGWLGGTLVNQTVWTPGTFFVDHATLSLPSDNYDRFRIEARGQVDHGVVFADVDNVMIEALPIPEPAAIAALGLGVLALMRQRRR